MNKFNFFKILEKDNKELIHSAFISYLIDTNDNFKYNFLGFKKVDYNTSVLEKTYREQKKGSKLKTRIDIEVSSKDNKVFVFIENKFKSFPYKKQLDNYDKVFRSNFKNSIEEKKILFCFDIKLIFFDTSWEVIDYQGLLEFLKEEFDFTKSDDETLFIRHYYEFLLEYVSNYEKYNRNCSPLFNKGLNNDEKFWLRLLNSQIQLYFSKLFNNLSFEFLSNPGNTSTPLLNIHPLKWREVTGLDILIQFQGNDLKFYIHSIDKIAIQKMIDFCSTRLWNENVELKKLSNRKSSSCFIFKVKVKEILGDNFSLNELCNYIQDFYENINSNIIEEYDKSVQNVFI